MDAVDRPVKITSVQKGGLTQLVNEVYGAIDIVILKKILRLVGDTRRPEAPGEIGK